jgi:hypothetical protein
MRKRIKILLIISAYLLNFVHDVREHDHFEQDINRFSHAKNIQHLHDKNDDCNYVTDEDTELPSQQCHLDHTQEDVVLRTAQTSIQNLNDFQFVELVYSFRLFDIYLENYFHNNINNAYNSYEFSSLFLRAPPEIS